MVPIPAAAAEWEKEGESVVAGDNDRSGVDAGGVPSVGCGGDGVGDCATMTTTMRMNKGVGLSCY